MATSRGSGRLPQPSVGVHITLLVELEVHDAMGRGDKVLNNLLVIEKAQGVSFILRTGVVGPLEHFSRGTNVLGPVAE